MQYHWCKRKRNEGGHKMARDIARYERNLMKDMDHWFDSFFNTRKERIHTRSGPALPVMTRMR